MKHKRHILDIKKLVDDNIIFLTIPGDGNGGVTKPNWEGDCSVITLLNLTPEELKLNPWRKKAMRHKLPQCVPYVQEEQKTWDKEKYQQVLDSINDAGKDINNYVIKDNNLQETIRKILREESHQVSPFIRRRSDIVRQAEREAFSYMNHIFKDHIHRDSPIGENAFTNMYCTVIMDGLYPHLSDGGTKDFDYDGVFNEIKNIYKELIHELWKHLEEKYNS